MARSPWTAIRSMYLLARKAFDLPDSTGRFLVCVVTKTISRWCGSEEFRMSCQSKIYSARMLAILPALIAVMFVFSTVAAAQEPPPPKWELFGGYSFFDPGADVHGEL